MEDNTNESRGKGTPLPKPEQYKKRWELALLKYREENNWQQKKAVPVIVATRRGTSGDEQQSGNERIWKRMCAFFYLIDCKQSGLICNRKICPDNPLPILPRSLCAYVDYHCLPKGEVVKYFDDIHQPIRTYKGEALKAIGSWNSPMNIIAFHAAVTSLHNLYELLSERIQYTEPCENCIIATANQRKKRHHGNASPVCCDDHMDVQPKMRFKGCPSNNPKINAFFKLRKSQKAESHVEKGANQLLPSEVRVLRRHLLNRYLSTDQRSVDSLKLYTMLLVGVSLFLRADELLTLTFEDNFVADLTHAHDEESGVIHNLVFKIKGKSDMKWYKLRLWSNYLYPELCPVRHLLSYLYKTGHSSGFIFPRDGNNNGSEEYLYNNFLKEMRYLCVNVLNRRGDQGSYGTHLCRKTAYLFAVWGCLQQQEQRSFQSESSFDSSPYLAMIMGSARHTSVDNAQRYVKDCLGLLNTVESTPDKQDKNKVGPWKDCLILQENTVAALIGNSHLRGKPLSELANYFGRRILKVTRDETIATIATPEEMNIPSYYETERSIITTIQQLNLPPPRHNLLMQQVMAFRQFARPFFLPVATAAGTDRTPVGDAEVATSAQNTSSSNTSGSSNAPVQPSRPKKRRKYGRNDLSCLNGRHHATDLERVNKMCTIYDTVPNSDLTLNAQSEFSRFYSNVAWCVRKCHNGDAAAFLQAKFSENGFFLSLKHSYRYTCLECKGTKPRKRVLREQPSEQPSFI